MEALVPFLNEGMKLISISVSNYPWVFVVCGILASITDTRWDNPVMDKIFRVINILALNILKAKNQDDVEKK